MTPSHAVGRKQHDRGRRRQRDKSSVTSPEIGCTSDGRSPGSRVNDGRRSSRLPSDHEVASSHRLQLRGQPRLRRPASPCSLLIPEGNHRGDANGVRRPRQSNWRVFPPSQITPGPGAAILPPLRAGCIRSSKSTHGRRGPKSESAGAPRLSGRSALRRPDRVRRRASRSSSSCSPSRRRPRFRRARLRRRR